MTPTLISTLQATENTYLSPEAREQWQSFAESVPRGMVYLKNLENQEMAIVSDTTAYIMQRFPKVKARIEGHEKTLRDLQLILRYCGQAALRQDPQFLEDQLLQWLRTMLVAYKFGQDVLKDSYEKLIEDARTHLNPETYTWLEPYLKQVLDIVPQGENQA